MLSLSITYSFLHAMHRSNTGWYAQYSIPHISCAERVALHWYSLASFLVSHCWLSFLPAYLPLLLAGRPVRSHHRSLSVYSPHFPSVSQRTPTEQESFTRKALSVSHLLMVIVGRRPIRPLLCSCCTANQYNAGRSLIDEDNHNYHNHRT